MTVRSPLSAIEISLDAVAGNLAEARRRVGPAKKIVAVIKADAYGHGVAPVASALSAADYLAVGTLEDGAAIRESGIETPVLLLGGLPPQDAPTALRYRLIPTIESHELADCLARIAPTPIAAFVKVDCGFRRFGVPLDAAAALIRHAAGLPTIRVEGVYTHLPFGDARGRRWAESRQAAFFGLLDALRAEGIAIPVTQATASPALVCGTNDRCSAIAIGTLLFGLSPLGDGYAGEGDMSGFRPAIRAVRTTLVHVGPRLDDQTDSSYPMGAAAVTGVAPVGFAHGYEAKPGAASMIVEGIRVPVLRVCMESTVLDLSGVVSPRVGARVAIVGRQGGEQITLQDLAAWRGSSAVNVAIRLGRGLPRRYSGST